MQQERKSLLTKQTNPKPQRVQKSLLEKDLNPKRPVPFPNISKTLPTKKQKSSLTDSEKESDSKTEMFRNEKLRFTAKRDLAGV